MKSKSGFIQKIAVGVVCVVIFSYAVYHIAGIFGEDIETYAAGITTESTTLSVGGYIFRDEQLLTSPSAGAVDYKVSDGTKVSEGQSVAVAYAKGKGSQNRIADLDEQIRILEESLEGVSGSADIVSVREQNNDTYDAIVKLLAAGETGDLSYQAKKLLVGMNEARAIAGAEQELSETLDALYAEREKIFSESGGATECSSPKNGYFFAGADGCEELFTMSAFDTLTMDGFYELVERASEASAPKGAYGRLTDNSEWGIVLPVKRTEKKHFAEGGTYTALFSENDRTTVPLYLERIIEGGEDEPVLLLFSCDRQPESFAFSRCQSVSITLSTVSGIYVPKSVVVRNDGTKGVYILRGSVVYFRYIEVIYEGSDYYLVEANAEHTEEHTYLRANDMIILNGKNMFDGRVLD